jgi:hypothetical protein
MTWINSDLRASATRSRSVPQQVCRHGIEVLWSDYSRRRPLVTKSRS